MLIPALDESLDGIRAERPQPHLHLLDEQFGPDLTERVLDRITANGNTRETAERKLSNALAYLLARSKMEDPNADLVINLGPDEAWHTLILFTKEYAAFCQEHAGEFLHHDPALEIALVNSLEATARTIALFDEYGIAYDPDMWRDHELYPNGVA